MARTRSTYSGKLVPLNPTRTQSSTVITFRRLAQAPRPHVGPGLVHEGGALLLAPLEPGGLPALGHRPLERHDRVLLLVVDDDAVGGARGAHAAPDAASFASISDWAYAARSRTLGYSNTAVIGMERLIRF